MQRILPRKSKHNGTQHYKWTKAEIATFKLQLQQVVKWTAKLMDRSPMAGFDALRQTNPLIQAQPIFNYEAQPVAYNAAFDNQLVEKLLALAMIKRATRRNVDLKELGDYGRVLLIQTLNHPAVAGSTYFDEKGLPPVDTWFYIVKNYPQHGIIQPQVLFAFVPAIFIPSVLAAMEADVHHRYAWLRDVDHVLERALVQAK
ncbi:hypothetical protein [Chitinophaga skermanii]|nr:hypothetical protein [Chitinophaga skermanii]